MDEHTIALVKARAEAEGIPVNEYIARVIEADTDRARVESTEFANEFHDRWHDYFVSIGDAR
jgi:hypothetical protein